MSENEKGKEKSTFKQTLVLVFIIIVAFGLTVYGIIFLANSFFDQMSVEVEDLPKRDRVMTDPTKGTIVKYTMDEDGGLKVSEQAGGMPGTPGGIPGVQVEPVAPKIEEKMPDPVPLPAPTPIPAPKKDEAQTKREMQKKAAMVENNATVAIAPAAPKKVEPKPEAKKAEPKPEPKKVTPTVEPKKTVTKPAPKETPKKVQTASVESKKYAIQLMSVKSKADAEQEASRLRKHLPDVYVVRADLGAKGVYYRVRAYQTDSFSAAKAKAKEIGDKLNMKPIAVKVQ